MSDVISQNLHKAGLRFHHNELDIGPGQTYAYGGTGSGLTFDVHGSNSHDHHANAHLQLTLPGPGFVGDIKLGQAADVLVEGMHATSYSYDTIGDHLKLFSGNTLIDELTVDTGGRGVSVLSFYSSSPSDGYGGTLISTGRFSPAEGSHFAIPVHT